MQFAMRWCLHVGSAGGRVFLGVSFRFGLCMCVEASVAVRRSAAAPRRARRRPRSAAVPAAVRGLLFDCHGIAFWSLVFCPFGWVSDTSFQMSWTRGVSILRLCLLNFVSGVEMVWSQPVSLQMRVWYGVRCHLSWFCAR